MTEIIEGDLYDYPKYYDLLFGSDWRAERDFLLAAFERYAKRDVQYIFEPACGTGRLLIKLAEEGYDVAGNDLNPHAVKYCNDRLQRFGFPATAVVGDMADFKLKRKVDVMFNMINSFRHLDSEEKARGHFRCVANSLAKGGLYVFGIHLIPTKGQRMETEAWVARRGNLQINSYMWSKGIDKRKRNEALGMTLDIYTPTSHKRIVDEMHYRTYTAKQMNELLSHTPELEIAAVHDFTYDLGIEIEIGPTTEDVVYVFRKV